MIKTTGLAATLALAAPHLSLQAHFTPFQAGDGSWHMAAPAVGNIDGDSALEIVLASRDLSSVWTVDAYDYTGARIAGFPYIAGNDPVNASPSLKDLDGDGKNEIIFTEGASVVALRGNGTVLWRHSVSPLNYFPDSGFHALTNGFYLSGIPLQQATLPLTADFFSEVSPPIIADVDADGSEEVLTAWKIKPDRLGLLQDYNPYLNDIFGQNEWGLTGEVWSGGVIANDARTGEQKFVYHFHQLVESGLAVAQLDDDPALEVLVLNDADSVVAFDRTKPHGLFGDGMLHKMFGKNLRLLSGSYQTGVDVHAADLDGDGRDEVLVPTTQVNPNWQPSENILDDDGALIWREWLPPVQIANQHGWFNNAALIPVNPDRDNRIDVLGFTHSHTITFRSWDGVKLAPRAGWPKTFGSRVPTPPVVGDVDGDEQEEIIIGTFDPAQTPSSGMLLVFGLDGAQKAAVTVPSGIKHIPAIADVDQNGTTEVIVRSLDGKITIHEFGAGSPVRVSWATHRGNVARDGNYTRNLFPPGTPLITATKAMPNGTFLSWRLPAGLTAQKIRIVRKQYPSEAAMEIASLPGSATDYIDSGLLPGRLYIYEVVVSYAASEVRSAPTAITTDFSSNLIANGGFERDDDSHWDKWFTGDIPWTNMTGARIAHNGRQSMRIELNNHGNNSTISQYSHYGAPDDYLPLEAGKLYSFGGFISGGSLTSTSRHWLEWDSSRTIENTNARPPLPWPNYFTPFVTAGAQPTPWIYLNRVFESPAGFPNAELRHRFTTDGPATGSVYLDDIFFRQIPSPDAPEWREWVPFGSEWRYFTEAPAGGWYLETFDDSDWKQARAKFGNGTGPRNIRTVVPANQPAYYFRKEFAASGSAWTELLLAATCTDDYGGVVYPMRIWLNGLEIFTGGVEAVSGEGNVVKYFDLAPFIDRVRPGTNLLAVMLQNTWQPTWDNVAFDLSLNAIGADENGSARIQSIISQPDGSIRLELSADSASHWRLESSDETGGRYFWRLVQTVSFPSSGEQAVADYGQNERLPPILVRSRVYRLVKIG